MALASNRSNIPNIPKIFGNSLLTKNSYVCPGVEEKLYPAETSTYETVYRPGKVNVGEHNSIASKLLKTNRVFKNFCLYVSQLTLKKSNNYSCLSMDMCNFLRYLQDFKISVYLFHYFLQKN